MGKIYTADNFVKSGGTSSEFLMADGSVSTGAGGTVTGTGTTNYISKFTGSSAIGNSIITDSGAIVDILANSSASIDTRLSVSSTGNGGAGRGTAILMKVPGSSSSANGVKINAYTVGGAVTAQSTDLAFDVGLSGTLVERMRITSGGIVLIGGASRQVGGAERLFQVEGTTNFPGASIIRNTNDTGSPNIIMGKSRATVNGGVTIVQDGDATGTLSFVGANGVDLNSYTATIISNVDGTPSSTSMPGRLVFSTTASGAVASTERMRITSAGNVGIGTTSPTAKLTISGTGTGAAIDWNNTTATTGRNFRLVSINSGGFAVEDITAGAERMRITSGGNLLVGTTTDYGRLSVLTSADGNGTVGYFRRNNAANNDFSALEIKGDAAANTMTLSAIGLNSTSFLFEAGGAERMRIFANGNTFIGASPTDAGYKLDVNGAGRFSDVIAGQNNAIFQNTSTNILNIGTDQNMYGGTNSDGGVSVYGNNKLHLSTNSVRRLTIDGSGSVGIGTTSPTTKLSVITAAGGNTSGLSVGSTNGLLNIWGGSTADVVVDVTNGTLNGSTATNLIIRGGGTERMRISSGGNVLIGTTDDVGTKVNVVGVIRVKNADGDIGLDLQENGTIGIIRQRNNRALALYTNNTERMVISAAGASTFSSTVTATGFFNSSDNRLKDLIDYDYNVSDIKPITYLWKDGRDNKKHVGYSAQEVQKVMPDAVNEDEKGFLSVNYVEVLVAKIEAMEKEIAYLKSKI